MSTSPRTVAPDTRIEELTELMTAFDYNGYPVVDSHGILQGLVTRADLFKLYLAPYRGQPEPAAPTAETIMSPVVITLRPGDQARRAIRLMVDHRVRTIPIVVDTSDGPKLVGIVTRGNLAGALKP
jgi:predicted transcriptional regulator